MKICITGKHFVQRWLIICGPKWIIGYIKCWKEIVGVEDISHVWQKNIQWLQQDSTSVSRSLAKEALNPKDLSRAIPLTRSETIRFCQMCFGLNLQNIEFFSLFTCSWKFCVPKVIMIIMTKYIENLWDTMCCKSCKSLVFAKVCIVFAHLKWCKIISSEQKVFWRKFGSTYSPMTNDRVWFQI